MGLLDILSQAVGGNAAEHFDKVAAQASHDELASGVAAAMRSDQTPPFGELVGQLFGAASAEQRAGMLNQIVAALGPAAASGLAGGLLGRMLQPGQPQITAQDASKLSPAEVTQIASHAEQQHDGVVDQLSRFYAEHSGLVKTLGGTALMIALAKMKQNAARG